MNSLTAWGLREAYKKLEGSGNRLLQVSDLIDWEPIRHILDEMYDNKSEKGGMPNCDVILMFKILLLQQWYGLSDPEVEGQIAYRISFMGFLGFPDPIPGLSGYLETAWNGLEKTSWSGRNFKGSSTPGD